MTGITTRAAALAAWLLLAAAVPPALAQPAPVRLRATIEGVNGDVVTLLTREREQVAVRLAPDATVSAMVPAELAAIRPGTFIGTAAVPQPDGTLRAQEVVLFPEAMRGVGEGHRPWDLTPDSTMTNATVSAADVSGVQGRQLTLTYKGGEQRLVVPPEAPIVTLEPGDRSLVRTGAHVFLSATPQADGTLLATRMTVGKDGLIPPM
ncbi:MAG: hypothetical protein U1E17_17545 [Geminicoccaceae bacterium]